MEQQPRTPIRRPGPKRIGTSNLRDVARRAGVSASTASRALSDADGVSPAARARVLEVAAELNYVVNGLARSMTGKGPRTIAFVVRSMVGPTFAMMAAAVERVATPAGHMFVVSTTNGDPAVEERLIRTMCEQRASAVLLVGTAFTRRDQVDAPLAFHEQLREAGAQLLLCGRPPVSGAPEIPSIDYDHRGGISSGVVHLVALGHRRIAYLGGPRGTTARARLSGYRRGLKAAGLSFDPDLVIGSTNDIPAGQRALHSLLDSAVPAPTAVVCETDNIAVGTYRALASRGLSVPHDLSVVGFDDFPLVSDLTPGLTTVRPPFAELGTLAGEIAVGQRGYDQPVVLGTELVVRRSTAAPSASEARRS